MPKKIPITLVLTALCFLVYANSLNNAFISDDLYGILKNPRISCFFRFLFDPNNLGNSFSYLLLGHNPFLYHLFSILLHSLNTLLAFFFLKLFFKSETSFLASALFAVHPIHTEAVTWISGRPYLFVSFFILSAYLLYHRAVHSSSENTKFRPFYYILALVCFSYGIIGSNLFLFLSPFFLALTDITLSKGRWPKAWRWWLPFIGIVIIRLILAKELILYRIAGARGDLGVGIFSLKNSLVYFVYSVYAHLWLLIWPIKLALIHEPIVIPPLMYRYALLYILIVILLLVTSFRKTKELFLALGTFIIFLAPTYSPVPIASLLAERYLYFPSIALSIFVAFLYEKYSARYEKSKKYFLSLFILIIIACGARTVLRNQDWKTPGIFWRKTAEVSPYSPGVLINLGIVYSEEGDSGKAVEEFKKIIKIEPGYALAYFNLCAEYFNKNEYALAARYCDEAANRGHKIPYELTNALQAHRKE